MPFYYKSHGKEAPNKFVAFVRRIYNPLGFKRGYAFPLWFILGGASLGFCASRAMYLDLDNTYKNEKWVTGDWEWQRAGRHRVAILMHLICVIPIGFLLLWQFLPIIRHKFMLFHRLNGYLLLTLLLGSNASAILMADRALGGSLDTRMAIGFLAVLSVTCAVLAYVSIKRLQIDQHRAWMLRCWVISFVIVTQRLIQLAALPIVSGLTDMYVPMTCRTVDTIDSLVQPGLAPLFYPSCANNSDGWVAVRADGNAQPTPQGIPKLHEIGAAVQATFAFSLLLAMFIHIVGVEVYLHLTPAEASRLKRVSYERQLKRGWKMPGDASWLTAQALGDAEEFDYKLGRELEAPGKDSHSEGELSVRNAGGVVEPEP
ncbi:unnamed protein product [Clonostachys rosea f. rosea IK726]|jgi:hypothetical protein|uniref:Microtubule associated protein n=2 Tax=Bionectria ochroleuca TaxID=29856 RepID=A0A8H7NCD0_BIOOC|nr:unnamed protein product [Clonostachys rosea f. rosea IK726]